MDERGRDQGELQAIKTLDNQDSLWTLFQFIGEEERHFNDLQAKYRTLASAWLLASLSAIGFVVSRTVSVGVPTELLVAGIAAAGAVGIHLLWVVDILVYHRLLDSCFVEGLKLESRCREMPPFRHNMMRTQQQEGVLFRVVGFYMGPVVLLVLLTGVALVLWFRNESRSVAIVATIVTVLLALLTSFLMYTKTQNTAMTEELLNKDSRDCQKEQQPPKNLLEAIQEYIKRGSVFVLAILLAGLLTLQLAVSGEIEDVPGSSTAQQELSAVRLQREPDYSAPDGSEVRLLVRGDRGSLAHFRLPAGHTSKAVAHQTVEEIWYFLKGRGKMWRKLGTQELVSELSPGLSINIPEGAHFQFRSHDDGPLEAVAVTMPPWPGAHEAVNVSGMWHPSP